MIILVAPNSSKECADSFEISKIISGALAVHQSLKVIKKPLSDEGDDFLAIKKNNATDFDISVKDEFNKQKNYKIFIDKKTGTAYLESALVIGLKSIEG
jgi:glycerate kinase